MRIHTFVLAALGSAMVVSMATAAPQEPGGRQGGRGMMPPGSPIVSTIDVDRDGILSATELDAAPAALTGMDRNKDGRIDRTEVMPMGRGREGGEREAFRGGRGAEPGETPATSPTDLASMLMAFDANKDGVLTKAELPERMQPIFDRSDANKDGKLTAEEIKASAATTARPAGRGERGGFGREGRGDDDREERGPVDLLFTALDANHDGAIDATEISGAPKALRTLDTDKDGRLTAGEYRQMGRIG